MIKQESILELKERLNIADVIKHYGVALKQKGAVYTGLCPFHDEKSASFTVTPAKNLYKCFGCGVAGDSIKFVMEYKHLDFIPAVKDLAAAFNCQLEEDKSHVAETEEQKTEREQMVLVNRACSRRWHKSLYVPGEVPGTFAHNMPIDYLLGRGLTLSSILQWELGFAPDEWSNLTPLIIDRGLYNAAHKLGVVRTKNERNYDAWRNRLMFPIHDEKGTIVGFGGRTMASKEEQKEKDIAKYMNSTDSMLFHKDRVLYGLYFAGQHIRKTGYAILVEGYTDVISFHAHGAVNTIATCGTSLTEGHCALLKRFTNHVVICRDGDNAGKKASMRDIDLLLKNGFKAEVFLLPEGEDPDSYALKFPVQEETELHVIAA